MADQTICMRCLHCGKVLPLLKRLSGGEFCSDAHRRDYQQEYSQLALNRLLQASTTNQTPANQTAPNPKKDWPETMQTEAKHSGTILLGPASAGTSLAGEK